MFSKSKIRKFVLLILLFLYAVGLSQAGELIVLNPADGHSNQKQITEALKNGDVYLNPGIYEVDGPIYIISNRKLSGHQDAIIRVYSGSSQWFTGRTGVISCKESLKNVEITGFKIDGNIANLPKHYADSRSDTSHDCEKLINIGGYSNDFASNIKIYDMKLYNSFSDGIYIIFAENVLIHSNFISNCQHEGIYLSVVRGGYVANNQIAGITSDCARLDNCQRIIIESNLFFSYGGNSYGAYKHGENGLQIGDAGSSHGYNAAKKGYPTKNIEVRF
ncbi:MAG: right-handed parallel beta-helix repeat-containing protein, partial [Syntrophomonadaceae bacterium]|nr:right-handed parallel beta-helix repeat-containing protein [Syntrophomonadaceae bacterium]